MAEAKEKKKEMFFLEQGNIYPWERPVREGYFRLPPLYPGSTELIDEIGFDEFNASIGNFRIISSAARYLANIQLIDEDDLFNEKESKPEKMVLFSGGITIYRFGEIPGTKIKGYDFKRNGLIWTVRKYDDKYLLINALENLLFEDCKEDSDKVKRVKAILNAYEHQEDAEAEAELKRDHNNYNSAFHAGMREGPSYMGGGPC